MAPNLTGPATGLFLAEAEVISNDQQLHHQQILQQQAHQRRKPYRPDYHWQIVWRNVIAFLYLHFGAMYGLYLALTCMKWVTLLWCLTVGLAGGYGITAGAHRLWAHRSYKARWPLRVMLAIFQAAAFQNHIYEWVRDHRVHHKFCDTDADPHNSKRGFFFSHIGWLMVRKHTCVTTKGKTVDMSDLEKDWVVMLQKKYYLFWMPFFCFFVPVWVPWYFWGEAGWTAWYTAGILRYTLSLNGTWLVNSAAHIWGTKPYDKNISPTENISVSVVAFGEGWHNYHHAFPWDYKTSELGGYKYNFTTAFIDLMAKIGWAYDLKTAPINMIRRRAKRTGDGTRHEDHKEEDNHHAGELWGWGDSDMTVEEQSEIDILHPKSS